MIHKKNISSLSISLFAFLSLFILSGCGSPSVNIFMKCTDDSNDMNAVQIKIYQLRSSDKFSLASRESLLRNTDATLGEDIIPNSKLKKIMIPGESFNLEDVKLSDGTKYIGIVGDFYSPAKDNWSQLVNVVDGKSDIKILIGKNFITVSE